MELYSNDNHYIMAPPDVGNILVSKKKIAQQTNMFLSALRESLLVKIL